MKAIYNKNSELVGWYEPQECVWKRDAMDRLREK